MSTDNLTPSPGAGEQPDKPQPAAAPAAPPPAPAASRPASGVAPTPAASPAVTPATAPAPSAPTPTPVPAAPACALVIDDEPANRDFLVRLLEQARLKVQGTGTAAGALRIAKECPTLAVIVVDNRLPDMDGIDLLAALRKQHPEARLIMATMHDERSLMEKAFENGCDVFMVKPHGFMELFRRLQAKGDGDGNELTRLIIDQYGPRPYRG